MTNLNSLQVMFAGIRFDIVHRKQWFQETGYPANTVRFGAFVNDIGPNREIRFNTFTRNVHPQGKLPGPMDKIFKIRLPAEVMTKNFPASPLDITNVNNRARALKANFRLVDEPTQKLLDGKAVMDIFGDRFKIDPDRNCLINLDQPWRRVNLEDLERVPGTLDLILPYDALIKGHAIPVDLYDHYDVHVRHALLPGLAILNTKKSSLELNEPSTYLLIDHPLGSDLKAVEIPYPADVKALITRKETEAHIKAFVGPDEYSIDTRNRNFVYDANPAIAWPFEMLEKERFTYTGTYDTNRKSSSMLTPGPTITVTSS